MIVRSARSRSGITLTEILISILIMGVGIVSLATLFPLGLIRLRKANEQSRSGYLIESAIADLGTRDLLTPLSIVFNPKIAPYYVATSGQYSPFIQDTPSLGADWGPPTAPAGAYRGYGGALNLQVQNFPPAPTLRPGAGLPIAYDPAWRAITNIFPSSGGPEARFGQGVGFTSGATSPEWVRLDPDGKIASAGGLQRITNLSPLNSDKQVAIDTFVSHEDFVLQDPKGQYYLDPNSGAYVDGGAVANGQLTAPSPVVPALYPNSNGAQPGFLNDYRFSWFFTGQQSDVSNGTVFDGDIVVCSNRQFGLDPGTSPFGGGTSVYQATGETVVEAAWGYSTTGTNFGNTGATSASNRTVLLRWPTGMPDPDIKIGGWIADVTYERNQSIVNSARWTSDLYPAQRCYWYQIAKRTEAVTVAAFPGDKSGATYRQMTVWTSTPLRAYTPLSGGAPSHVEAALIMPCVVNVYPRTIYSR